MQTNDPISNAGRGLSATEVEESRLRHGANLITPPKDDSVWQLFLDKFRDPIVRILLVAALLSLAIAFIDGEFTETIGILSAVVLATGVGFLFEWDAMRRFKRLNRVNDDEPVKVVRDGSVQQIARRDVVVGDWVLIESGETIPADGFLVEAVSLRVNESTLTGEPICMKTTCEADFDPEATYPSNRLLRGTTVSEGYGCMVIDKVGDQTEAGRVTEQSTIQSGEETPLNRQLEKLSRWIGRIGFTLAGLLFLTLLAKGLIWGDLLTADWVILSRELLEIVMISVAVIVMAVPEGLPMAITLSLALSMRRMLKTNNLVRKMHACETMGAVTVICTDKTGTLTQNRMTVEQVVRFGECRPEALHRAIAANTTAHLDARGECLGNPTEGALLAWLKGQGVAYEALRHTSEIVDRLPFSTELKYMATLICLPEQGKKMLLVKGAPEIVRTLCVADGLDERFHEAATRFQHQAMRTLGLAWCETEAESCHEAIKQQTLKFEALFAIGDPVREEVPDAVARCLKAGIGIKVVTGDTPATATEIARRIGLWDDQTDTELMRITGPEFAALTDEELLERVQELKIIARARPLDKQRLVQLLQRRGEVVAVTGDGTNDAPALNFAHVGLAMGSGTSVAKEAGDITLLDDSFRSIVTAILWGRSLYRNIQRFILFQLTINFAAILIVFLGSLFGTELPLTVVQMLWVNLIMDTFAAMALASLPPEEEVMSEKPRPRERFIITRPMALSILGYGSLFVVVLLGMMGWWHHTTGAPTLEQLTIFFSVFVFLQFWNLFNAKGFLARHLALFDHRDCRLFFAVLLLIGVGQVAIVEWGGEVFRTGPLSLSTWGRIIGFTSLVALGGELLRLLRREIPKKR